MINIGLVGYGYWGPNVARNIHRNGNFSLKVICDKKADRLKKAKELYLDQTAYSEDFNTLLEDQSIEAIAVAVETSSHYDVVKKSLDAGKHVYVEKPFTDNVVQAQELLKYAKSKNLIIHVDHIMIFHPGIQIVKDLVEKGELGDILYVDASRMNLGQIKMDVNSMWDLAIHDLSVIDNIIGGLEDVKVSAVGERRYSTTETLTFLTFTTKNFIAHIKSSWISPLKERRMIIAGSKKMIVFDDMKAEDKLRIYDKGVDVISDGQEEYEEYAVKVREGDIYIPLIPHGDALYNSLEHFRMCIVNGEESISGPSQAIRLQKILEEADKQMKLFGEV